MRLFAWACVVGGVLLAAAGLGFVEKQRADLRAESWSIRSQPWVSTQRTFEEQRVGRAIDRQADELSSLPWLVGGAALAGFGVLVLAIRRPQPKEGV